MGRLRNQLFEVKCTLMMYTMMMYIIMMYMMMMQILHYDNDY